MANMKIMAALTVLVLMVLAAVGLSIPVPKIDEPLDQLSLPLPRGACSLSPDHHRDKVLIRDMKTDGQGANFRLESLFADCQNLDAWRVGQASLGSFGFYLEATEWCEDCGDDAESYAETMARHGRADRQPSLAEARRQVARDRTTVPLGVLARRPDIVVLGYLSPANRDGSEVSLFLKVYFSARRRDLVLNLNTALPSDQALPEILDRVTTTIARAQHATLML